MDAVSELSAILKTTETLRADIQNAMQTFPGDDCIRWPFHSAYRPEAGAPVTAAQQAAISWRNLLATRNERLRVLFIQNNRKYVLDLFQLCGFGSKINFGQSVSSERAITMLDKEAEVIRKELSHFSQSNTRRETSDLAAPAGILRAAIEAVPAVKWALGVAGVISAVALVKVFFTSVGAALLAGLGMFVLMTLLVLFARMAKASSGHLIAPAMVLTWAVLILVIASASLCVSSAFFDWPKPLPTLFDQRIREDLLPSITGHVTDHETRLPVMGAEIKLDGRTEAGQTDDAGNFLFNILKPSPLNGMVHLFISKRGYEDFDRNVRAGQKIEAELLPKPHPSVPQPQPQADNRAMVVVKQMTLDRQLSPGEKTMRVAIMLGNTAKLPATRVSLTEFGMGTDKGTLPPLSRRQPDSGEPMLIAPGADKDVMFVEVPLAAGIAEAILSGKMTIYFHFLIEYYDSNSPRAHHTEHCGSYPTARPPFLFNCPAGGAKLD